MLSAAQRLRNSKAAQKSTGPTSEAGKKRSSQNAVKHGLTAKTVMLPGESVAEFQQKLTGLFDGLKPRDPFEVALVERGLSPVANRSLRWRRIGTALGEGILAGLLTKEIAWNRR